jgi:hypothetical protein
LEGTASEPCIDPYEQAPVLAVGGAVIRAVLCPAQIGAQGAGDQGQGEQDAGCIGCGFETLHGLVSFP